MHCFQIKMKEICQKFRKMFWQVTTDVQNPTSETVVQMWKCYLFGPWPQVTSQTNHTRFVDSFGNHHDLDDLVSRNTRSQTITVTFCYSEKHNLNNQCFALTQVTNHYDLWNLPTCENTIMCTSGVLLWLVNTSTTIIRIGVYTQTQSMQSFF